MRTPRLLTFLALAPLALAAASTTDREKSYGDVSLDGPDGKPVTLASLAGKKATVVVFLSFDCPVSASYVAPLNDLARAEGVAFLGVAPSESADGLKKAVKEYQVRFPVLSDAKKSTTKALGAKVTPEVFVFDAGLKLRYRGRIDDAYAARLKKNARVTSHDLKDALAAVVAGKDVKHPTTPAIGCPIEIDTAKSTKDAKATYHRDVAPILQKHCQGCHRPGEVGPFSLTSYKHARRWAADVKEYTKSRQMPPWMPRAGGPFKNERRLSDKEIETLAAWADAGAPEGDEKSAPPPVKYADGWALGKPDLVLSVKDAFHVAAAGKDVFRCFVLPMGLKDHVWVTGYEVKPGAPRVVHHTLHYFDTTGTARKMEQKAQEREKTSKPADHGPGYSVAMGVGFTPPAYAKGELPNFGGLGGWAPGQGAQMLPKGAGWFLPAGSDFLLQVHYHRDGKPADDRTQVGLYFAKAGVEQPWQTAVITGLRYDEVIPAGKARHVSRGAVYLHDDALLHNVMPHMHLLGKSVKVTMTPPDGKPATVVEITEWDYRWQETYWFEKPILAKRGTKLEVEGIFDNSDKNPNNPNSPPKKVGFGEQTTDEMLYAFLGMTSTTKPWSEVRFRATPPTKKGDKPADPLAVLKKRVGTWETETVYRKSAWTPKETKYSGTETSEMILKGKYLESKGKTKEGETKELVNWDAEAAVYRAWYFDSEGVVSQGTGTYDEKTKTLTWDFTLAGVAAVVKWKFVSDDAFEWEMLAKDESEAVLLDVKGTMKRKKQ